MLLLQKTVKVIKSPAFLSSVAIWSHLAQFWPGLNFICKENSRQLQIIHYNRFSITTTSIIFFHFSRLFKLSWLLYASQEVCLEIDNTL